MLRDAGGVRTLLLDIEGTTTPVDFVYRALFPYARTHLREFLERQLTSPEVRTDITLLRAEHGVDATRAPALPPWRSASADDEIASVVAYALWLMDQDRKSTGLKSLQGRIWEAGYRNGELRGQLYRDVPPAFMRWRRQERDICIFSSGSVQAQQLLFSHSTAGDLTPCLREYFDTTTGPKNEAASYQRIAATLGRSPSEIMFLSDVPAELDAALHGGMRTTLCVRAQTVPADAGSHPVIHTFDDLFPA